MKHLISVSSGFEVAAGEDIAYSEAARAWVANGALFSDFDGTEYEVSEAPGNPLPEPQPPAPPAPPTVQQFVAAMDANFDAKAAEKNYDSRITCALRAGYAGPFQAEGIAFAQWMDNSYAAAYQILAAVQAGQRPAPESTAALLAELPQFDWANV